MKISEDQLKEGRKLAKEFGFKELYMNEKGEFFTNKSYASMSVGYDKDKFAEVPLTIEGKPEKGEEKATNDLDKAADIIAAIEVATEITVVNAILKAENEGKKRPSVIKAATNKLATLEQGTKDPKDSKDSKVNEDSKDLEDDKDLDPGKDEQTNTNKAE